MMQVTTARMAEYTDKYPNIRDPNYGALQRTAEHPLVSLNLHPPGDSKIAQIISYCCSDTRAAPGTGAARSCRSQRCR